VAVCEEIAVDRERDHDVRAGLDREVDVGERASVVVRGSSISFAPRCCAARTYGMMWMPDAEGLTPQRTISFASG
jgi:hypothetical protein